MSASPPPRLSEYDGFEERTRLLYEARDLGLMMLDAGGLVTEWNRGAERLLGYRPHEIIGHDVADLHVIDGPEARKVVDSWLQEVVRVGQHEDEGWRLRRDQSPVWVSIITTPLRDEGDELGGFLCILRDAGERRHAHLALQKTAENLEQLAATDSLTGLKNRREFDRVLRTIPRERFAVIAVDVDHLKQVNDEEGHEAGDVLLRSVATTLSLLVRGWDVLARLGGDEFGALLPGVGPDEAAKVAERMRIAMHSVPSTHAEISIGWATAPAGADPRTVWRAADASLYRAKRSGRDQVVGGEFAGDEPVRTSGLSNTEMLAELFDGGALGAVYQPILALGDGHVIGYEALARPARVGATDSVESLFGMARQTGRIRDLDWLCRRVAVGGAGTLPGEATLFVNTSISALLDPMHDVDQLLLLLSWARWPTARVVLELGQHERVADMPRLLDVLERYRTLGVRFALDDVGEGHATLAMLAAVRPEFVKVARSLTMTASRDASRHAIEATLAFGRSSGATTIAQGVENEFAADQMQAIGIEFGQGFGLAKPAAPDAVVDIAAAWAARAALRPLRPRG
ncbi:MAG TPA: GGDEF domain-containing protein [Candidatus Dormibacteraeota bacterium]|jgi:diguanylate cyclase (GGDEF)-like protein/PAS domain S-box-containing protein|nr:GGDEF domain-containing protein [Candidatus Dormibacteraeota bacterium]